MRSRNVIALNSLFGGTRRRNECDNGICVSLKWMGRRDVMCKACVYSKARIEYHDFNSLHCVAAISFLAVDIDNTMTTMHAPSIHHISLSHIPYHPPSSNTLSRRSRIHLYKRSHTLAIHPSIPQIALPTPLQLRPSSQISILTLILL